MNTTYFKDKVKNRFADFQNSFRKYYAIIVGLLISGVSYLAYNSIITTVTLVVCTFVIFIVISLPVKDVELEITEEFFSLEGEIFKWTDCLGFVVVDLGETLEFTVQTNKLTRDYVYFYLPDNSELAQKAVTLFTQFLPYNQSIAGGNVTHNILRYFGLK
jgi:hypothetical protein